LYGKMKGEIGIEASHMPLKHQDNVSNFPF
jgi:hypothetical protein